jgi:subtilisin family serine protease
VDLTPAHFDAAARLLAARQRAHRAAEPRLPARFDNVFGVAAINGEGKATRYSNRGDMPVIGNGVAAWGGDTLARNVADAQKEQSDQKPGGVSEHDAVVGLYSAETLPPGPGQSGESENTTGWVKWAGTSFATPVISALAAEVWAKNLSLSPMEVIRAVIDEYANPVGTKAGYQSAKHLDADLQCPVIPAERAGRR